MGRFTQLMHGVNIVYGDYFFTVNLLRLQPAILIGEMDELETVGFRKNKFVYFLQIHQAHRFVKQVFGPFMHVIIKFKPTLVLFYYRVAQAFTEGEKTRVGIFHGIERE